MDFRKINQYIIRVRRKYILFFFGQFDCRKKNGKDMWIVLTSQGLNFFFFFFFFFFLEKENARKSTLIS